MKAHLILKWFVMIWPLLLLSQLGHANNLMRVYNDAYQFDPTFQAARAKMLSDQENMSQARALLMPTLMGTANTTGNRVVRRTGVFSSSTGTFHYNNKGYKVTFDQPIINVANWMTVKQTSASVKQAAAEFAAAKQALMTRTATAYFAVLEAKDILRFSEAEKAATAQQLAQARTRYKVGLDAITSVFDARARYDNVSSRVIAARNDLKNRLEALRAISGKYYETLSTLKSEVPLVEPAPADINRWENFGLTNNLNLVAARFATSAAKSNIKVQFAGHLPTVDVVANYIEEDQGNAGGGPSDTNMRNIGLQVNLPLFAGGAVVSKTRQARYDYQQAQANEQFAHRQVINNTRQSYNNIVSGISKIKADQRAIISNESSLKSSEAALRVGTRTIVDVLIAQQQLYLAQQVHAVDQYALINSILALKEAAGTLAVKDLAEINTWLTQQPSTTNPPPPKMPNIKPLPTKKKSR